MFLSTKISIFQFSPCQWWATFCKHLRAVVDKLCRLLLTFAFSRYQLTTNLLNCGSFFIKELVSFWIKFIHFCVFFLICLFPYLLKFLEDSLQLLFQLEHKLVSVPEKKQQNETFLEQEKQKINILEELAPIKSNVSQTVHFFVACYFRCKLVAPTFNRSYDLLLAACSALQRVRMVWYVIYRHGAGKCQQLSGKAINCGDV